MKRGRLVLGLTTLLCFHAVPTFADDVAERLESIVVDNFADPEQRTWLESGFELKDAREWVVTGSKFATDGFPILRYVDASPDALAGSFSQTAMAAANNTSKVPAKSLGVKSKFDRKGYNFFELYPVKKDDKGNLVPAPISLPGITKMIDLWVWGSNFRTTIEVHLRDYRGIPYVLSGGSLNYPGWRNISITVPGSIPQTQPYLPTYQGLSLTKFVIRTEPTERVDEFYTYFTQLKVLSDMHQNPFDGKSLLNPDFINKNFADAKKEGK